LNSECSQQDRADENERGAHSEHIQFQGKVHGSCLPCCDGGRLAQNAQGPKTVASRSGDFCMSRHALWTWGLQPVDRPIQNHALRKNAAVQYRLARKFVRDLSENEGKSPQFRRWHVTLPLKLHAASTM
jgi:hypothetical protein